MKTNKLTKRGPLEPEAKFERVHLENIIDANQTLLVALQQRQNIKIERKEIKGTGEYILGHFDLVNWKELIASSSSIRAGIVAAGLARNEAIVSLTMLSNTSTGWDPVLLLIGEERPPFEYDQSKIEAVIELVLVGLKHDTADRTRELLESPLATPSSTVNSVRM